MRRAMLVPFVLVLCAINSRVVLAQTTGTISGTVTASSGGTPISSAEVVLFGSDGSTLDATANSSGVYSFSNLKPGTYYLFFNASGFVPQAYSSIPCAAQSCYTPGTGLGVAATPVVVSGGATTTVDASLDRGATISGTVRRASDGSPIANETVLLYDSSTSPIVFTGGVFTASVVTQSDGTYSFSALPFGTYYARTQRGTLVLPLPDYLDTLFGGALCPGQTNGPPRCRVDSGTPIVVSSGSPSATADFNLPVAGHISGRVTSSATGNGIANLTVAAFVGSTQITTATTDSGGNYQIVGLDPGTYFIRTLAGTIVAIPSTTAQFVDQWYPAICAACVGAKPHGVAVTAGTSTTGIDFALPATTGAISGTVTLPNSPNAVFGLPALQVFNSAGALVSTVSLGTQLSSPSTVLSFGWTAGGLPDGTYYVRTTTPPASGGYWVDQLYSGKVCVAADCLPTSGVPLVVTNGSTASNVNFTLDLGAHISGGGAPSPPSMVQIFDSRGVLLPGAGRIISGHGGIFPYYYGSIGLPAGTYYVLGGSVLYRDIPCVGCAVTTGTPVTLTAGGIHTDADGGLFSTSAQTISGAVRSDSTAAPANQPLSTIAVEVYGPNGQLMMSGMSMADGTYKIFGAVPGTYYLRTRNTRGFIDQVYNGQTCGACDPLAGTAVVVTSGSDVSGIDFALPQGQTVSGQVVGSDGGPVSTGVLFYTSAPSSPSAHVTTDAFGGYSATVPPGSYFVQTDPVAGYSQQIYNGVTCAQGTCPTGAATSVTVSSSAVTGVNFNLPVCAAGSIAPVTLALAAVGATYRQTLLVAGASGVRFSVSSGTLPPGLTLDPVSGVLSGTPTASGHYTFTVSATDGGGCVSSRSYTLDVPPCAFTLSSASASLRASGEPWLVMLSNVCGTVTATSNASWITVPTVTQTSVTIVAAPNTGGPRQGTVAIGSRVFTVFQSGAVSSPPFGSVDSPADGAVVAGSIGITGWALDDVGVSQVLIYRDPVAGEPSQLIFIGTATFVPGARPDVAAAYPTVPFNTRAGWGYLLLTNELPNQGTGTFRFSVFAQDADLNQTLIGTKVINAVNSTATAPFGAIDTPGQGATISGSAFVNFGWALTPQPKMIPMDGSTIQVVIDGVTVGNVTAYNLFRSDVSGLFPGLKNSGGPVGYRVIDTTALSEGVHTIAWIATDDGGVATGIGSRFFTVQNSAWQPSLRANFLTSPSSQSSSIEPPAFTPSEIALADSTTAVPARVEGVDLGRQIDSLSSLPLDAMGARTVTMTNLQVLQLSLMPAARASSGADGCGTYAGYLVVNGELHALPVGSSLDPAGTFYWHPGPAFFGTYQLLFVRTSCNHTLQRIPVTITIH